ncbi:MAG TPA: tRNA lysidine(34) synthetase TilS [Gemmatimonadaceae bacterium]|nr:tRNA lysidine(34) synthetase TilS [Gemmatimonadaceae bacterium]
MRTPSRSVLDASGAIATACRALLERDGRFCLAVSGGADSMVLLHAMAHAASDRSRLMVATFDHATGPVAADAVRRVRRFCRALGVAVHAGRAARPGASHAEWRAARWRFLREVARTTSATIVTAHTEDDQVETVVLRILRGAGARGLAGLAAPSSVARPLLGVSRATVEAYARHHDVPFIDDPANADLRFTRNAVRHRLLPLLAGERPEFRREMILLGERAAELRRDVENFVAREMQTEVDDTGLRVAATPLAAYDSASLRLLWPALLAPLGVALDWRGIERLTAFASRCRVGAVVQLSGGFEVIRERECFLARRAAEGPAPSPVRLTGLTRLGEWSFRPVRAGGEEGPAAHTQWRARLPTDRPITVRTWRAGDRFAARAAQAPRRVARYLTEARVPMAHRAAWPVVLVGDEIVWIPGVRRADVATAWPGRPTRLYVCERTVPA